MWFDGPGVASLDSRRAQEIDGPSHRLGTGLMVAPSVKETLPKPKFPAVSSAERLFHVTLILLTGSEHALNQMVEARATAQIRRGLAHSRVLRGPKPMAIMRE